MIHAPSFTIGMLAGVVVAGLLILAASATIARLPWMRASGPYG